MTTTATRRIDRVRADAEPQREPRMPNSQYVPKSTSHNPKGRPRGIREKKGRRRFDKQAFLDALYDCGGCIAYAAEAVGVTRDSIHYQRQKDEDFALDVLEVRDLAMQSLEVSAFRRAFDSELLTMFLLKAHQPAKYRDNYTLKGPIEFDEEQLATIAEMTRRALVEAGISPAQERAFKESYERHLRSAEAEPEGVRT